MGRLLDNYVKKHNLFDTTALSLIGLGCVAMLKDDDVPVSVKARMEELEQDAKRIVENSSSIIFPLRGGFMLDPDSKDD